MQAQHLAALIVRVSVYAAIALAGSYVVHARSPANPIGAAFVVLFGGIAAVGAARALTRRH